MPSETRTDAEQRARHSSLEENVLLVSPTLGYWRGHYHLPADDTAVSVAGETVAADDITSPQAKLLTDAYPIDAEGCPWKKRFQRLSSRLERLKKQFSVPFPIAGVRIIPKAVAAEFLDAVLGTALPMLRQRARSAAEEGRRDDAVRLADAIRTAESSAGSDNLRPVADPFQETQAIAYDLRVAADQFCEQWDDIRRQLAEHSTVYAKVQQKLPQTAEVLRRKFFLDVTTVQLATGVSDDAVDRFSLARHSVAIREACYRRVDEAISSMIEGPRAELSQAVTSLSALIARGGRVTAASTKPVTDAIQKLKAFAFVADDALLSRIRTLEQSLESVTPAELRQESLATAVFVAAIRDIADAVVRPEAMAAAAATFGKRVVAL